MSHDPWKPGHPFKINPWVEGFGFSQVRVRVIKKKPMGDPCISLLVWWVMILEDQGTIEGRS